MASQIGLLDRPCHRAAVYTPEGFFPVFTSATPPLSPQYAR
jgi:hypothetical protein